MSKVKKTVLATVATLALALIMGATTSGPEYGMNEDQASGSASLELMQLAAEPEHGGAGG